MILDIGFDADDTLWHTESLFQETQARLEDILAQYAPREEVEARLHKTELANVRLFGYGIKGFTLSLVETAIEVSNGQVKASEIQELLMMGKAMLDAPIDLMPGVHAVLETLRAEHRLFLITKGDVLDQTNKIDKSGLGLYFDALEVVQEKSVESYADLFEKHSVRAPHFLMIGNSIPSDVLPVLELGGFGVHVPYHITAVFERADNDPAHDRFHRLDALAELPDLVAQLKGARRRAS
ncbi:MAG: HAD hydrolase-like protein [Alphaproteobacteria bacterium]|nr:HAD hydrolase-like protein [Alphaproteobacteria bacterium]